MYVKLTMPYKLNMTTYECIQLLRQFKALRAQEYGIERMGIFGSMARSNRNER